jgi:hypothetical protein
MSVPKKIVIITLVIFTTIVSNAQVGIGTSSPDPKAVLELSSANKGLLVPRMAASQRTGISSPSTGLLVFQTDGASGFYYYTGSSWKQISNVTSTSGAITSIDCANAKLEPSNYSSSQPYTGVLKVPYSGGNGGTYANGASAINSTVVTGLSATLQGGTLNYGTGELTFNVTGTPSTSSPSPASFLIPTSLGATGCTVEVGKGRVLNIGEAIIANYKIPVTTTNSNTFDLSTYAGSGVLPQIDGLEANLVGVYNFYNSGLYYIPRIYNRTTNNITITYQTSAPSVNQYKTEINKVINANGGFVDVDNDSNVFWTAANAETITTNVQVAVGNTYRRYEFKWWCMEVNLNKVIFVSVVRNL